MKKGYYYFIFMFICTFFYITSVSADGTKTCYYNDGKGNEGQFSYVKTNDGYEFGNQYAIYDGLRSTNWSYRKDENTQDVLAWSGYTIKEYFSKGQCAPYLIYFKANGLFTGDDSTEIFPGDPYILQYDYTNYYSKKDWDNNDTLNLIPLVDTKENELNKFSTLLGQNINEIKELLNGDCKNGNKSTQCINKFVTIRSSADSIKDKYNRLLELGKISSSDKEYSLYNNDYLKLLEQAKNLYSDKDDNKDNAMDLSGCIIDKGTQSIIDWIMNLVRIGGVILLVVLGMLDFVKAAASGEQEEMKKSKSKFVKRLIACVVLFFVPIIVDILVGLVNLGSGESCNSNDSNDKTDDSNNRVSYQCSCKYYRSNVDEPNISDVSLSFDVTNKDNFDSHTINYNGKNVTVKINSPQKNATSSTDMLCPKKCSFDESKKVLTCSSKDNDETFQNNNPHFYQAADENGKLLENCKIPSN